MNNLVKVSHHYWMLLKLLSWNQNEQQNGALPFQTRVVQQGIPRNPDMSPYVEMVSCGEFFLVKILQKSSQGPTKVHIFQNNK